MNTAQRLGSGIGISALIAEFVARVGAFGAQTDAATLSAGFQLAFLGAAAGVRAGSGDHPTAETGDGWHAQIQLPPLEKGAVTNQPSLLIVSATEIVTLTPGSSPGC